MKLILVTVLLLLFPAIWGLIVHSLMNRFETHAVVVTVEMNSPQSDADNIAGAA